MTAQERQAIAFLLALTALGTAVRVIRARSDYVSPPADSSALALQLDAVDSAVAARKVSRRAGRKSRRPERRATEPPAYQAPINQLDITAVPERRSGVAGARETVRPAGTKRPVDLDVAGQAEIESLPWVGPALASRIIENRQRCGPFGSPRALERVPGIGSRTVERLSSYVTFSLGTESGSRSARNNCPKQ